ncbi:hypothetical protein EG329_009289 [Mollisiaceae sp. DMI_Dod_QoI]|nr:hypothetical protein EG329_009289 [Helotiales sp. DMI_Dod_QoI]
MVEEDNMFSLQFQGRKREREDDEENMASGFGEHRTKRHIAALPHRRSPKLARNISPIFNYNTHYTSQPLPPTITPADSDSEDVAAAAEPRSFFSPYSSSPTTATLTQSGSPSPFLDADNPRSSQSTQGSLLSAQMSDAPSYSDDFEMTDSFHLSPGPFHNDPSSNISGRIPTPIHSSFSPFIRSDKATIHHDGDLADDESMIDRFRRGRRLPSPISEGEMSPSIIIEGVNGMQVDSENQHQELDRETPTKKGHQRSKHSLRQWTGFSHDNGNGNGGGTVKRSFSMG